MTQAPGMKNRNSTQLATRNNHTWGLASAELLLKRAKGVAAIHAKGKGGAHPGKAQTSSGPEAAAEAEAKVVMLMTFGAAKKHLRHRFHDTSPTPIRPRAGMAADVSLLLDVGLLLVRPDIDMVFILLPMPPRADSQAGDTDDQAVGPPHPN